MGAEKVEIDKKLYDTMRCLIVALMDKHYPDREFILTKEHRKDLIGRINIQVCRELLDNLDERFWLFP